MVRAILKTGFLVLFCIVLCGIGVESSLEVEALMEMKTALDPRGKLLHSWVPEGDPCSGGFEGVACNEHGKVANVSLQGRGLSGFLPSAVAELRCLSGLYLHYNNLKGEIPREISNLTELVDLYLNVNMLSGSIPQELGSMPSLQALQLCCNELNGSIPSELGSLKKLSVLALQHNHLTGAIPASLGKISYLTRLDLSFNNLTGSIPQTLTNLTQLTVLDVRNNNLSGLAPRKFKNLQRGFQYGNNPDLCAEDFLGLPQCNSSVPFIGSKPIGTRAPNITSNPVSSLPKIPETADLSSKCQKCSSSSSKRSKIGIVSAIIALVIAISTVVASFLFKRNRKQKQTEKKSSTFKATPSRLGNDQYSNYKDDFSRKCTSPLINLEYSSDWDPLADGELGFGYFRFNLDEIESATNYFSDKNLLGKNGFACVYKGVLRDGTAVAVKCINKTSCKADEVEFQEGLKTFMQIRHENLVNLRGFCCSKARGECFLVYEFVQNGTLLHSLDASLDWSTRVRIAHGVARGIEFLHQGPSEPIVHQNITAGNILLDQHFNPLLSDCALHKLLADDIVYSILKSSAAMGYLAPEYATIGRLTDKSDVYAFGKILLQLLSGTSKHVNPDVSSSSSVYYSIRQLVESGKLEEFMDPNLNGKYSIVEATNLAAIALACTNELACQRPAMDLVVQRFDTGIHEQIPPFIE